MNGALGVLWLIGLTTVLPLLMIVALSYGLVFSINSFRRDIKEYR